MNNNLIDYAHSCRLCLTNRGLKIHIFEDETNTTVDSMLSSKILTCVSIRVEKEDPFPTWICGDCQGKIDDIFEFRRICSASDAKLRNNITTVTLQRDCIRPNSCEKQIFSRIKEEGQKYCTISDDIKIKQESTDNLSNADYYSNEIGDQVFVKVEDPHSYESERMDLEPESETEPQTRVTELLECDPLETEFNYPHLLKSESTRYQGLEIEPVYSAEDNVASHFLVLKGKRSLLHSRNTRKSGFTFECPMCGCPFTYQAAFDKHRKLCRKKVLQTQSGETNGLVRRICRVEYKKHDVLNHKKIHRKKNVRPKEVKFECHICNIVFQQKGALICHQAQYHRPRVNKNVTLQKVLSCEKRRLTFECQICNIVFQQKGELICHQAQYHRAQVNKNIAQQKVFSCDKCRLSFAHKGEYILHNEFDHTMSQLASSLPIYETVAQVVEFNNHC